MRSAAFIGREAGVIISSASLSSVMIISYIGHLGCYACRQANIDARRARFHYSQHTFLPSVKHQSDAIQKCAHQGASVVMTLKSDC